MNESWLGDQKTKNKASKTNTSERYEEESPKKKKKKKLIFYCLYIWKM